MACLHSNMHITPMIGNGVLFMMYAYQLTNAACSIPLAHLTELPSTSPPVELPASPTFNQKVAK